MKGKVFKDGQEITVTRSESALCLLYALYGREVSETKLKYIHSNAAGVLYSCTFLTS